MFKALSCELQEERGDESMFAIQKKDQTVVVYPFFVLLQQLPKVLEFLFLLEGWAVDDEMILFTMKAARLRGDLVRSMPRWIWLSPMAFCSFVMMVSLMVLGSGVLVAF
jgi:hypothetical protein